jgi:hypothetical protein
MKHLIALSCLVLVGCLTPPDRVTITPTSSEGLILVEVDPTSATIEGDEGPLTSSLYYFLTFSRYPARASGEVLLGDWVHVNALNWRDMTRRFYAEPAPAGTYAFEAINFGGGVSWGTCFNRATVVFEVPAGEVLYLGKISLRSTFEDIARNLPAKQVVGTYSYLFDRTAPAFVQAESKHDKSVEITDFLHRVYPNVTSPIRMAELRPATFQQGKPNSLHRFPRCAKTQ